MIDIVDPSKCCGCEACVQVCAQGAISMQPDAHGILYPAINQQKCKDCGLCDKVCHFVKEDKKISDRSLVYAVKNKNTQVLRNSSSGGAFSAIAQCILAKGGHVYGVAWSAEMTPYHICIDDIEKLLCLQGSKYVQSRINDAYKQVRADLKKGLPVLFSGTPCQCAGLRSFLFKEYENLYCVELVCHGVPAAKLFREYLDLLESKYKGKIIDFKFRDKFRGWGNLMTIVMRTSKNKIKTKHLSVGESYYYYYYLHGVMYRPSCYNCKYANSTRESDFTIGDYWGVNKFHPEIQANDGVSVLLLNTSKAKEAYCELERYLQMIPSELSYAQVENGQLKLPSKRSYIDDYLWKIYEQQGVLGLYNYYRQSHRRMIFTGFIKRKIPVSFKRYLRKQLSILKK